MENASKALTIAGGVLIAVMLAVLVYYVFTHWGDSQRMQQEEVEIQRVEEFNKSYLSYEKVLYGSELLGLINKMNDYNDSDDVKYDHYDKMDLYMKINELSGSTDNLFSSGSYKITDINNTINNIMKETTNSNKYKGKISDSQWEYLAKSSNSSDTTFNNLCAELNIDSSLNRADLQNAAKEYYKYVQFKRMKFKHTGTTFASSSGRVETMSFEETR